MASKSAQSHAVVDSASRIAELEAARTQQGKVNREANGSKAAAILLDFFNKGDSEGLRGFSKTFSDPGIISYKQAAEDLVTQIPADKWPAFLEFIKPLDSREACTLAQKFLVSGILANPEKGSDAFLGALDQYDKMSRSKGGGVFNGPVWGGVGEALYHEGSAEKFRLIFEMASKPRPDTSPGPPGPRTTNDTVTLLDGLSSAITKGINAGESDAVKNAVGYLSKEHRRAKYQTITGNLEKIDSKNYPTFSIIMDEMLQMRDMSPLPFIAIGLKFDDSLFRQKVLEDPTLADSVSKQEILRGWASNRPKKAVELVIAKTGNPELAGVAFSAYATNDSMEASQWLQAQPAGPVKEACTEQLCSYLISIGSAAEAKGYLQILSPAALARLKSKYPRMESP